MEQKLCVGRMVRFVLPTAGGETVVRPAVVTIAWSDVCANLHILFDGNDSAEMRSACQWSSVCFDESKKPNTWHWPERV